MHDRMDELLSMATSPGAASVKQRQIADALVDLGRIGEAAQIAEVLQNRAEVRTVCARVVGHIPRGANVSSGEWEALDRLHARLGSPQRRDVLEIMDTMRHSPSWPLGGGRATLSRMALARPGRTGGPAQHLDDRKIAQAQPSRHEHPPANSARKAERHPSLAAMARTDCSIMSAPVDARVTDQRRAYRRISRRQHEADAYARRGHRGPRSCSPGRERRPTSLAPVGRFVACRP